MLDSDRVTGKDIEKNENVCDTLDAKEDLFCEFERLGLEQLIF